MKHWIKAALTILLVCASTLVYAQDKKEERSGSGNTASVSSTARIDAVNKRVGVFVGGQQAELQQAQQLIVNLKSTILTLNGLSTQTLLTFTPEAGCDPESDPHGCKCACSGPNQKLIWSGNATDGEWQCYRAEQACPSVPPGQKPYRYNPETCKCEVCESCPVLVCDPPLVAIANGTTTSCGGQGGECACITSMRRPGYGLHPDIMPFIQSFDYDSDNCPTNIQCKNDMTYSLSRRDCCCDNEESLLNGQCGNVCPSGTLFQSGPLGGYATALGYCYRPEHRIVATAQECDANEAGYVDLRVGNGPDTCGGGDGICCQRRIKVPYTPFGSTPGAVYMGCSRDIN